MNKEISTSYCQPEKVPKRAFSDGSSAEYVCNILNELAGNFEELTRKLGEITDPIRVECPVEELSLPVNDKKEFPPLMIAILAQVHRIGNSFNEIRAIARSIDI